MMTLSMARPRASSVPGLNCSQTSARFGQFGLARVDHDDLGILRKGIQDDETGFPVGTGIERDYDPST